MESIEGNEGMTEQQPPRGDEEDLFRTHNDAVVAIVASTLGRDDRRDIAEQAVSYAWMQFMRYQPEREHVRAWLVLVARREAWAIMEKDDRAESLDAIGVDDEGEGEGFDAMIEGSGTDLDLTVELREIRDQIDALPARQREVFRLNVLGYDFREIAAQLGISERAARKAIERARRAIRERRGE